MSISIDYKQNDIAHKYDICMKSKLGHTYKYIKFKFSNYNPKKERV